MSSVSSEVCGLGLQYRPGHEVEKGNAVGGRPEFGPFKESTHWPAEKTLHLTRKCDSHANLGKLKKNDAQLIFSFNLVSESLNDVTCSHGRQVQWLEVGLGTGLSVLSQESQHTGVIVAKSSRPAWATYQDPISINKQANKYSCVFSKTPRLLLAQWLNLAGFLYTSVSLSFPATSPFDTDSILSGTKTI